MVFIQYQVFREHQDVLQRSVKEMFQRILDLEAHEKVIILFCASFLMLILFLVIS